MILILIIIFYVFPFISAICLCGIVVQKHLESDRAIVISEFLKGLLMTICPILNWIQAIKLYMILKKLIKRN